MGKWAKFFSLSTNKNEKVFSVFILLSIALMYSSLYIGESGLFSSIVIMVIAAIYYAKQFFCKNYSFENFYYFLVLLPFIIFYYALIYKIHGLIPPNGEENVTTLPWLDVIYFSVVTWTGLGYGDYRPGTEVVKYSVITEVLFGYIYMGLFLAKMLLMAGGRTSNK